MKYGILTLLTGGILSVGAATLPLDSGTWRGWNETYPATMQTIRTEADTSGLEFTIPSGCWNTPICTLPAPVRMTALTMLRFRVYAPADGDWELNLFLTPGAEYSLMFPTTGGKWITVQKYLFKANYKRGTALDTLLGAELTGFQLAVGGGNSPVRIADVELFEGGEETELPADNVEEAITAWRGKHPPVDYALLGRNGVFPFGAVTRMDANACAAGLFGRDLEASFRADLVDMKRHGLNTYLNFCEVGKLEPRLQRSEEIGMRLIETSQCATRFAELPEDAPQWQEFEQARNSPALLAWYGPDEPQPSRALPYLADKAAVTERDGEHPYTSAFHLGAMRRLLGGAMEVMIPDCYSLFPGQDPTDPAPVLSHFVQTRLIREQTGGRRVWFMTQTFSNRHKNTFSARYPTPEEIRLDMYTLVAGGASGILFFIYNDLPTYLDGTVRGEEFDATLVDPWGNGNAVYDEIADFGRRAVPVMPSFLDAEPSATIAIRPDDRLLVGQSANALGTLLVAVNQSLTEAYRGILECHVPEGMQMYDLITLLPTDGTLALRPGEGSLLAVTTPEHFAQLKSEIAARRELQAQELAELRRRELAAAGFSGEATPAWLAAEQALAELQTGFSAIHRQLSAPEVIVRVDGGAEFAPLHERLKELSRRYFAMRTAWAAGSVPSEDELEQLRQQQKTLTEDYRQRLSSPAAENP